VTELRFLPVPMTKDELLAVLDDMRERVAAGDSFEGFLNYLIPDEPDKAEFAVEARYRVGNLDGQGGMRMIGEWSGGSEA
jgi:hypothetical protein